MISTLQSRAMGGFRERVLSPYGPALLAWGGLITGAHLVGSYLVQRDPGIKLFAPPLFGRFDFEAGPGLALAVALAAGVVLAGGRLAERVSWRSLVTITVAAAALWAVAVAAVSGIDALTEPLLDRSDYLRIVPEIGSAGGFLRGFTDQIGGYPIHVQGHPPGMVLLLWWLGSLGFGGAGWAALLVIGVGVSSAAAVLIATRSLAGEEIARRAAPFIALSPLAIWIATSADGLFAGVAAWSVCLAVLACRRAGWSSDAMAIASGLLLGALFFLTYGAVGVAAIAAVVVASLRRLRVGALIGAALGVVVGAFALAGFWWLEGLFATMRRYEAGVASDRPYAYFLIANLAAFAVAIGPAVAVGVSRIEWRRAWLLPIAALVAVGLSDLSGLSKGEVERIWLPFAVWVVPVCSLLMGSTRRWLSVQAGWSLLIQMIVRTPW